MKHLKKLSVVLMMTTLFSVSFTSCIDNEVSPLVEAIYEAQADLIAAQAGVQNAEAALLLAQANAEQAQVAYVNAQTAQQAAITAGIVANNAFEASVRVETLRALVASTNAQVAASQNAMAVAQAQFNATMANLTAQMQAAGATLAVTYANQFAAQMGIVNALKADKLTKEGQLAIAELYLKAGTPETTWTLYLAGLNAKLAAEQAKVTAAEAAIVTLNTAKANPTARETQIAGLKTQKATLEARKVELVAQIALAEQNRLAAQKAIDDATAFMSSPNGTYATAKANLTTWKAAYTADSLAVKVQTANVATYTAAIANYAGTTNTLTTARNTAVTAIGQNTAPLSGLLGDIKTIENTLGVYGTAPVYGDAPRTGAAALTAYGKLWNADLALLTFEADFAQLTASYNQAALDLVSATTTYTTTGWPALITAAQTALTTAQGNVTTDLAAYNIAKTEFEANPTGIKWFDGDDTGFNWVQTPFIGNHADALPNSFAKILTFVENPIGSGQYRPATYSTTYLTAIPANVVDNNATPLVDETLNNYEFGSPGYLTAAQVITVNNGNAAYYVNVENDDYSTPLVTIFNDASNKLGVEVTAPFYTGTTVRNYTDVAPRNFMISGVAGYYNPTGATTYQLLWNAAKLVSQLQYQSTAAAAILADAQEKYDYQKGLFETGLATRATLEAAVAAQVTIIGKVTTSTPASGLLGQWEALKTQLGTTAFGTPISTDAAKTTAGTLGSDYYMVGTVKTLTAYAVKWNAELALAKHLATTVAQYQTMLATAQGLLTTATREAAEDLIYIAKYTADLAALQAQYDALILTPLYAALNVTLVNATQAKAALEAEDAAATISITSLGNLILALAATVPDYTALIAAENLKITTAKAAILATQIEISKGGVDLAGLQANVQLLKDQIAALTIQIANAQAIADKYKALMNAALAS